jgi:hypothetical protein
MNYFLFPQSVWTVEWLMKLVLLILNFVHILVMFLSLSVKHSKLWSVNTFDWNIYFCSVIAQASCRISKPKESRTSEGHLRIHLDMSKIPMMNLENWKLVWRTFPDKIFYSFVKTSRICSRIKWYSWTKYSSFELYRSGIIMHQCRRISMVN